MLTEFLKSTLSLLVLIAVLLQLGCDTGSSGTVNPDQPLPVSYLQLHPADNCDNLKNFITESLIKQYATIPTNSQYYYCPVPVPGGGGAGIEPPSATAPSPNTDNTSPVVGGGGGGSADKSPVPTDVSDTNNQEQDVHESDIVKADAAGNIYILSGRHFIVAKGFPPQDMNKLAEIDLGARGLNLFLDKENSRVVILARDDQPYYITDTTPTASDEALSVVYPKPESDYSVAIFYDVSDPANPQIIDQIHMRGYFTEGRRINNRLHLISRQYLRPTGLYEDTQLWDLYRQFQTVIYQTRCIDPAEDITNNPEVVAAQKLLIDKIKDVVDNLDPSEYLPDAYRVSNGSKEPFPYLSCTDINFPRINLSLGLQIVTSVDSDGSNLDATGIINNGNIAYASKEYLYLVEPSRSWWWTLDNGSRPSSQTAIYKFAISANAPKYIATGRVDGYVNNQFSLSEFNGALRVASTEDDWTINNDNVWQRIQSNHLSILTDNGQGLLEVSGAVRNFAPNENIRSARFLENRGFVVTFRNVDPLFTFDLTDPLNPVLMGELTIPGFSTYMHPYDDNHLITIGRAGSADGTGVGNGMQLQLIDISDMTKPVVIHSYIPNTPETWSWSDAAYDHKAFTFYRPANLLAIPLQISPAYSQDVFSGISAMEVTIESGFRELGRVDHADLSYDYYCSSNPDNPVLAIPYIDYCSNGWYMQWAAPRRTIVMTDSSNVYLYSLSDVGLKASAIGDLKTTLGSMVFPPQPYPWWYFGYYDVAMPEPLPVGGGVVVGGVAVGESTPSTGGVTVVNM